MFCGLFLTVPWVVLQYVIVVFPDYTHLLFAHIYNTQFLRSRRLFNMAIYQPFVMLLVMPQPGFLSDSIHFWVLILSGSWPGNGKISCWQAFNNSRDSIQEAFCYLCPGSLKSSLMDALEKYVCKLYQPDAHIV